MMLSARDELQAGIVLHRAHRCYARQGMEGRKLWFHMAQLLNGRYRGELS
ncbi:hypothetical protein IPA61_004011 [Escherichia coli]|nr:hypothetical protein [Escherichia coli]EGK3991757.1 hypothetical protein [Escherichia coli]HAW0753382.1 hypothetical protein [Escherichia coli]